MKRLLLALAFALGLAIPAISTSAAPEDQGYYAWSYGWPVDYSAYVPRVVVRPVVYSYYQAATPYGYFATYNSPCSYVGWLAYGTYGC